jgi:dihydroorotate dehydrogenase electron transfer subunit
MKETSAEVKAIDSMSTKYKRLRLITGWSSWVPGQFVMVRTPGYGALTRRPFGIVDINNGVLEICFKIIGPGTQALSHVKPGEKVDVLGPLGSGFEISHDAHHVLIAGGYGIAPLLGFARRLSASNERVHVFYGAKTVEHVLYLDELAKLHVEVEIATEDGSVGHHGLVTDLVNRTLSKIENPAIYACGPKPLMKAVAELGSDHHMPVQVSMDQYMACGTGVCLGCICEAEDGSHLRACREGPVFKAEELKW